MWYKQQKLELLVQEYYREDNVRVAFTTPQKIHLLINIVTLAKPELALPLKSLLHYLEGSGKPRTIPAEYFKPLLRPLFNKAAREWTDIQGTTWPANNKMTLVFESASDYPIIDGSFGLIPSAGGVSPLKNTVGGFTYTIWYDEKFNVYMEMEDVYDWDKDPTNTSISVHWESLIPGDTPAKQMLRAKVISMVENFIDDLDLKVKRYIKLYPNSLEIIDEFWNRFGDVYYHPKPYVNSFKGFIGKIKDPQINYVPFGAESNKKALMKLVSLINTLSEEKYKTDKDNATAQDTKWHINRIFESLDLDAAFEIFDILISRYQNRIFEYVPPWYEGSLWRSYDGDPNKITVMINKIASMGPEGKLWATIFKNNCRSLLDHLGIYNQVLQPQ